MGNLYVVATPIGNLEDITLRALRVLKEVNLIAAEDTRKTLKLLNAYSIKQSLTSYHEHNKLEKLPYLLGRLEQEDIALVSEAGMPGMSDPGIELVARAAEQGIRVIPVPGASAIVTALAVCGLSTREFVYLGFLPRKKTDRNRALEAVRDQPRTIVVLESPRRLLSTLETTREILGERKIVVCRELTKLYEEVFRGTVGQALEHFVEPRGEFTIVFDGAGVAVRQSPVDKEQVVADLRKLRQEGWSAREAIGQVAMMTGLPRRDLYRLWLLSR